MKHHIKIALLILLTLAISSFARRNDKSSSVDSSMQGRIEKAKAEDFTMTAQQLRIIMQELTGRYTSIIETHADYIIQECDSTRYKNAALTWKLSAIPILYRSMFYNRPLIGLIDTWAYAIQMKDYFQSVAAAEDFGPWVEAGFKAAKKLENEVKELAITLPSNGNVDRAERDINAWAKENPINGFTSFRESMILDLTSGISASSLNAFQSLGKLTNQLDDIMAQVTVYGSYIPKGMEWQSELILQKIGHANLTDSLRQEVSLITSDIHSMEKTIASLPTLVQKERNIVFREVARERDTMLEALATEREIVLATVAQERKNAFKSIDSLREAVTTDASTISKDLVNLIFKRAIQFTSLFFVLGFISLLYLKKQRA